MLACCAEGRNRDELRPALPIDVASDAHLASARLRRGWALWIGVRRERVKSLLGIPAAVRVVELMPLGYPREAKAPPKQRLPIDRILRRERWT